jgi:S-adenosylmethionine:tRNA ribosyltransferase-isomerase
LEVKGVEFADVVLHVGLGTFKPVKGSIEDHVMHAERFEVAHTELVKIADAIAANRPVIALGTTAFRVIESLAWVQGWQQSERAWRVCSFLSLCGAIRDL